MKKSSIIIIFLILFTNLLFAQSNFDRGFEVGYKKGFCQDQGIGCIEPITPISPIPGVNESYNNYTDGYNRGFTMAIRKRNSVKSNSNSENSLPKYKRPVRKYNTIKSNINYKQVASTLNSIQSRIDYNKNVLNQTLESIDLRKKSIHRELNSLDISEEIKINLSNKYNQLMDNNIDDCAHLAEFESITGTQKLVNCLNFAHHLLDNLESNIYDYSISNNRQIKDKNFVINSIARNDIEYCNVTKIFNKDNKTVVELEYTSPYEEDTWINISADTYIYDVTNDKRLELMGIWNTEYSPKQKVVQFNKKVRFQLTFEKLQNNSQIINIIECERESCFNFYGIYIQ